LTLHNVEYWINSVFCKQITIFCDSFISRIWPIFDQIDSEAEEIAAKEWKRLGIFPLDEYSDMGDLAERAIDVGLEYFKAWDSVRQTMINLIVAALYHLFEQQRLLFHRKQILQPTEENNPRLITLYEFEKRLNTLDINIKTLPSWNKVNELRVVANVVKHAEGPAAKELKKLRPTLFTHPKLKKYPISAPLEGVQPSVYMPLAGEDIYLTIDDIENYRSALLSFWREFGDIVLKNEGPEI